MFIQGPPSKRRFTCNPCGENNEVLFAEGSVGNAPLRECSICEALKAIRRQAWKLGLISQQRYATLCRWHPEW